MERNIHDINREFSKLNASGMLEEKEKRKEKGDYTIRYGITKKPCFKKIDCTKMLPPLHYWICSLKNMENFAYHINTPVEVFNKKKRVMRRFKRKGKKATKAISKMPYS